MTHVNSTSRTTTTNTPSTADTAVPAPPRQTESVGVAIGRMSAMLDQSEEMSRRTRREARTAQRVAVSQQTAAMREAANDKFAGALCGAVAKMAGGAAQMAGGFEGLGSASAPDAEPSTAAAPRTAEADARAEAASSRAQATRTANADARAKLYSGSAQAAAGGAELIGAGFQKSAEMASARAMDLGAAAAVHGENAADDAKSIDAAQRSRDKMLEFASQLSQAMADSRRAAVA